RPVRPKLPESRLRETLDRVPQRRCCWYTPTRRHFHGRLHASWMTLIRLLLGHWARVIGHKGKCHRSGNPTVQRAPGVRSTLKLPPSRCASALTKPRPDKRLLGSSKSKPNPSSCT